MEPVVVLLSGGLNSTAAAARLVNNTLFHFLHVDYGQAAAEAELGAARRIAEAMAGWLHAVKLPKPADLREAIVRPRQEKIAEGGASMTPAGGDASAPGGNRLAGQVLAMVGVAQELAVMVGADTIVCGASEVCSLAEAGGGVAAADTKHVFYHGAGIALELGAGKKVRMTLDVPFMETCRADVVRVGNRVGAPLRLTWSCHSTGTTPCGGCSGCLSRQGAFDEVGIDDPAMAPAR